MAGFTAKDVPSDVFLAIKILPGLLKIGKKKTSQYAVIYFAVEFLARSIIASPDRTVEMPNKEKPFRDIVLELMKSI
jgi:hypothetical protein